MKSEKKKPPTEKTPSEKEQITELTELLQRDHANFENYRKQTEKRIEEIRQMASRDMLMQILPVIDNFELALKNTGSNSQDFLKGIELIYSQLITILENQNVKQIPTENKIFDPFYHEALMKVDSDKPENTIIEELRRGFTLNEKVIRHAKVKLSSGKKPEEKQK